MTRNSRKVQVIETRLEDLEYQIGVLEEVKQYTQESHKPVIMRLLQEKAAEHKHFMKMRKG